MRPIRFRVRRRHHCASTPHLVPFLAALIALGPLVATSAPPARAARAARPDLDLSDRGQPAASALAGLARLRADASMLRAGVVTHVDERYAVPTFVWGTGSGPAAATGVVAATPATAEQMAREHLARLAPYYRLDRDDVNGATLRDLHDTGTGGRIASFTQQVDGFEVFRDEVKVLMDRNGDLVAVSGYIPGKSEAGPAATREFRLDAREAIGNALQDFAGAGVDPAMIRHGGSLPGGYDSYAIGVEGQSLPAGLAANQPIRAKRVLFHLPGALVPAYYLELVAESDAESYVISAADGSVLMRHDLIAYDSYTYRVWADATALHAPLDGPQGNAPTPHPTGLPDSYTPSFIAPTLLSLQNGPISTNDPWLPPGATVTTGNNVDAYADLFTPDGFTAGDVRPSATSPGTFNRTYDTALAPGASANQTMAATTQLFVDNNFLHDWFYDAGFNEAAGNAQTSNFGRGGVQGDAIHAEAQDYSGRNNADMATPADGGSPRMQMYVWDPAGLPQLTVVSPASIAGAKTVAEGNRNTGALSLQGAVARMNLNNLSAGLSTYSVGSGPEWVAIADFNMDGHWDFATANFVSNDVSMMLNNGFGNAFGPAGNIPMGTAPYTVMAGNFNGDIYPDIVTANTGSNNITVRLNQTGGGFGFPTSFATGAFPAAAVPGRLDADALDDVVTANYNDNTVSVLLNNGAGGFAPKVDYPVGASPNWVAIADMNSDGRNDLLTANFSANTVSVLLGNGSGGFGVKTDYPCGTAPVTLALADLNGDNRIDVVTANSGANTLSVLLNGPAGLGAPASVSVPASPVTVTLGDVNADGLADAVVCCDASNQVAVLYGVGNGTFQAPATIPVGTTPYGVQIGDVSVDGVPDLVCANYGSNNVTVIKLSINESAVLCPPYTNHPQNRIVLVDANSCAAHDAVYAAQSAGASAVLLVNNAGGAVAVNVDGFPSVTIPVFSIGNADGTAIKTVMRTGPVVVTLTRTLSVVRDAALDNQIVAHEWGHHLSNRLIGNANGLVNRQGQGMGEGWSDFVALLMTVKPEDAMAANNANFSGVYSFAGYVAHSSVVATNAYYFGGRRYPYSTNMTKSPLTFKHITLGAVLPAGLPVNANNFGNNEVHNVGDIWCTVLWECYASLLRDTGRLTFAQSRDRMRQYLVASLKLTPNAPTMIEGRDALLAAAYAVDYADYALFCAAFAKRGFGTGAVAPDRNSDNLSGVVESFTCGGDLVVVSGVLDDAIRSCDGDGLLDGNEIGLLTVILSSPAGSVNLNQTTATVSSSNPSITFPNGNAFTFGPSHPYGTTLGAVRVALPSGGAIQTHTLTVQYNDPGLAPPAPRSVTFQQWGNADEVPSAADHAEARSTAWTFAGPTLSGASTPWQKITLSTVPFNHAYFVTDPDGASDRWLVSPPLQVGSGPFGFTFKHAYSFDDNGGFYDGGVVEITTNGGGAWGDIGASIAPGYGGTILNSLGNPLQGRPAFVGTSAGYPALATATASLGTTYAGQTVQIRFRIGADFSVGKPGWTLDDIVFTGIANTPFLDLVADPGPCTPLAVGDALPTELSFASVGANPVVGDPTFRFALPRAAAVRISLFDVSGRRVATLADGDFPAGEHTASWNVGRGVGQGNPGVYFARMTADGRTFTTRMVLLAR